MSKLFTNLFGNMPNGFFSKNFLTWGGDLKLITQKGEISPSNGSIHLYRYMPLKRFMDIVQKRAIAFVSPYLWHDPFEFLFYNPNTKIGDLYYNVYALCFTVNSTNEEAKWQNSGCNTINNYYLNGNNDELIIRVKFNLREFCKALAEDNHKRLIFVSHIDYSHKKKEIVSLLNKLPKDIDKSFNNLDKYIYSMSIKRKAFTYENEVRLFVIEKSEDVKQFEKLKNINFNVSNKSIPQITLPPKSIKQFIPDHENAVIDYKTYLKKYKEVYFGEYDDLKCELERTIKGLIVKRSVLYNIGSDVAIDRISLY